MKKAGLFAAVLNSRQAMHPCRKDSWVLQTEAAVKWIKKQQLTLLSSIGLSTYDLLTTLGSVHKLPMMLLIPSDDTGQNENIISKLTYEYRLHPECSFRFLPATSDKKKAMKERDKAVINTADILIPVSIRNNSSFEKHINKRSDNNVLNNFKTPYNRISKPIAYSLPKTNLNKELTQISNEYLIHWTKCSNGPWHGETLFDYYTAVLKTDSYPRTAFDTLRKIVTDKVIKASSLHIPENKPCVAFTNRSPVDMIPLFKWRARYRQMSFEPYGIGIKKYLAVNTGIKKIRYIETKYKNQLSVIPGWLSQSSGVKADWTKEEEYRHAGDFIFNRIDPGNIILFTRFKEEADQLRMLTGYKTIHFID